MLLPFYAALAVALVFYLLLPVVGAYITRAQWRRFRETLLRLARSPLLRLGSWSTAGSSRALEGLHRFHGEIEALEGEDRIWVRGRDLTAVVDLGSSWLHILADGGEGAPFEGRYTLVERVPWSRVRVFPESARVFIGGALSIEEGIPVFREAPGRPLIVVSYEGKDSDLFARLIAGGRVANEYWNPLSRASIGLGVGILGIFFAFAGRHWLPTVLFLSVLLGLAPVLCLLPPGLPFFFLYRRLWRRSLDARVLRDLCRLPLRYLEEGEGEPPLSEAPLPGGGFYRVREVAEPPPGCPRLRPGRETPASWNLFEAEGSEDPDVGCLAVAGDPRQLSRRSERRSLRATLLSGLSLGFALILTMVTAFLVWRAL